MKRKILLMLLAFCSNTFAAITDGKFGMSQIFDVQYNWNGTTLNASNFIAPYDKNWSHPSLSSGQYFSFFNSTTNPGQHGLGIYNADGTRASVVHDYGTISALGNGAIFYLGSGFFGNVISTAQGYSYGSSASFTNMDTSVTSSDLNAYTFASSTPLAAGQTAAAPAPTPVNNTTAAGTLPGGFIGRVLNNTPGTWQTYSFTFTPSSTGANYVMLSFRQDPAFWTVDNIRVTAPGSTTNLLVNGDMASGGQITAQTNNGPTSVSTPTNWGVAYQAGIYPGAAGSWNGGSWYDGAVGSFDGIYQAVNLTAGVTYTMAFDVNGDNVADSNLSGSVQLGVYAGACGDIALSPEQCTLPSNSGYTTLATPQEGASAGTAAPTQTGSSTSNNVSSSSSVGATTITANPYSWGNNTYTVTGRSTPTTTTTTTTPVTTTYWSDGTTTTSSGTSSTATTITYNYSVTGPSVVPVSPYSGTNINGVYINQVNAGASNNVTVNQSGNGNYESVSLGGSNNTVRLGQGYTFNGAGQTTEAVAASNNNLAGLNLSGNTNTVVGTQVGASNSAIFSITGNTNALASTQTGNNNQVYSTISGNNNSLTFGQSGNSNIAAVNLYGNSNSATVTQTGNNHGTVLNLVNAGGANTVSVVQTGTGDAYSLQQTCTNPAGCGVSVIRNK